VFNFVQLGSIKDEFFWFLKERRVAARELILVHDPPSLVEANLAGFEAKQGDGVSFSF